MRGTRSTGFAGLCLYPNYLQRPFLWLALLLATSTGLAQQTILYQDAKLDYENLVKEYDQGYYARCIRSAEKFLQSYQETDHQLLRLDT